MGSELSGLRGLRLLLRRHSMRIWAVVIAFALWFQVHGSGVGSVGIDAPLQVRGLDKALVVVNDLPETVRVTISGLQARINRLSDGDVRITIDASDIDKPGVIDRAISVQDVRLPAGMNIVKIQPDRVQLQVDRVVSRRLPVRAAIDIPEQWRVDRLTVEPAQVQVAGPEVWLDALSGLDTETLRPPLREGGFTMEARVVSPTGRAVRMVDAERKVKVSGVLSRVAAPPQD
ncbi:MAG: hypothetical protein D6682_07830 [Zetaproteobacteria bacterium]|nr:MAG: hypothetical protein D6682_07830 [Zetaproteobacteria bacterium]